MTPSREAIDAAKRVDNIKGRHLWEILEAAYAIDVAQLEQRIRELEMAHADAMALVLSHEGHIEMLEAENQRLKAQVVKLIRENPLMEERLEKTTPPPA